MFAVVSSMPDLHPINEFEIEWRIIPNIIDELITVKDV